MLLFAGTHNHINQRNSESQKSKELKIHYFDISKVLLLQHGPLLKLERQPISVAKLNSNVFAKKFFSVTGACEGFSFVVSGYVEKVYHINQRTSNYRSSDKYSR